MKIKTNKLIYLLAFNFIFYGSTAQNIRIVTKIPEVLDETSGIEVSSDNEIWSFNDSGGEPKLYQIDTLGNLLNTVTVFPGTNKDWEDITQDNEGNMYIGDFGNNANSRTDLKIYKIKPPFDTSEEPEVISFSYEDQNAFPPSELRFDCESVIWYQDNLYLFTKHRNLPMATNIYKIPDTPGEYVATKVGSFLTGQAMEEENEFFDYWITAADLSPDNKKLALLSGNKVWLFTDFEDDNFFEGNVAIINLGDSTQKEGICFKNNFELYITDEYWSGSNIGRNLYLLELDAMVSTNTQELSQQENIIFYPNPSSDKLFINGEMESKKIYVLNSNGQIITELNTARNTIDLIDFPNGLYYLIYAEGDRWKKHEILKLE